MSLSSLGCCSAEGYCMLGAAKPSPTIQQGRMYQVGVGCVRVNCLPSTAAVLLLFVCDCECRMYCCFMLPTADNTYSCTASSSVFPTLTSKFCSLLAVDVICPTATLTMVALSQAGTAAGRSGVQGVPGVIVVVCEC